jgi:hypothetical protein
MSDVIFAETVESVVLDFTGSKLMYNATVDGDLVTIMKLYIRANGDQDFSEVSIPKDMLRKIYEATMELDTGNEQPSQI